MGLELTTRAERLLTWLGMWGAIQGFPASAAAIVLSVLLLESLSPSIALLFSSVPANLIQVSVVGIGLLLGLIGYFAGDFWDEALFEACYGPRGKWLDTDRRPLRILPAGSPLKRTRNQAAQALGLRAGAENEVYREAVKVARRQAERWERIEHPLILSRYLRGFLWPCLFVALLALSAAAICPFLGAAAEVPRLLAIAGGCVVIALTFLVPYCRLRFEHLARLYQDVARHAVKKKPERR